MKASLTLEYTYTFWSNICCHPDNVFFRDNAKTHNAPKNPHKRDDLKRWRRARCAHCGTVLKVSMRRDPAVWKMEESSLIRVPPVTIDSNPKAQQFGFAERHPMPHSHWSEPPQCRAEEVSAIGQNKTGGTNVGSGDRAHPSFLTLRGLCRMPRVC